VRGWLKQLVEDSRFQNTIMVVIVVNAITLGLETSPKLGEGTEALLHRIDQIALTIFVLELFVKLYVYRLAFFRNPWNVFDLLVVGVALVPAADGFSVLRALRVLRVLRLVSGIPSMRRVVSTLLAAIPGAAAIIGLLALVIYVSAVMGTTLFGPRVPQHFGDLGTSLWTLFQTLTGEAWPDIADDVMAQYPMSWIFFLIFILISTFVVLNLFLAVIVGAMESVRDAEDAQEDEEMRTALEETEADIVAEIAALRHEVMALRGLLTNGAEPDGNHADALASPPAADPGVEGAERPSRAVGYRAAD
jgi:voltage-gated sodium channel